MRNEPAGQIDPQTIWQNQETEKLNMSVIQFLEKAKQRRARARWIVIAHDIIFAAFVVLLGFEYFGNADTVWRIGFVLLGAGMLYVTVRQHQQQWPLSVTPDSPPATGLEVYRRELQRSNVYTRNVWPVLGPLVPGCLVIATPALIQIGRETTANPAILLRAWPFCALFALWLVIFIPGRKRRLKKLQDEIDSLDRLAGSTAN